MSRPFVSEQAASITMQPHIEGQTSGGQELSSPQKKFYSVISALCQAKDLLLPLYLGHFFTGLANHKNRFHYKSR